MRRLKEIGQLLPVLFALAAIPSFSQGYMSFGDSSPFHCTFYNSKSEMLEQIKSTKGFQLILVQTPHTPLAVSKQLVSLGIALRQQMPDVFPIDTGVVTTTADKKKLYYNKDLEADCIFFFNGEAVHTFRLSPDESRSAPTPNEIASSAVKNWKENGLLDKFKAWTRQCDEGTTETAKRLRDTLPSWIEVVENKRRQASDYGFDLKDKNVLSKEVSSSMSAAQLLLLKEKLVQMKANLPKSVTLKLHVMPPSEYDSSTWVWKGAGARRSYLDGMFFEEPYLSGVTAAISQAAVEGDKAAPPLNSDANEKAAGKDSLIGILAQLKAEDDVKLYGLYPYRTFGDIPGPNSFHSWPIKRETVLNHESAKSLSAALRAATSSANIKTYDYFSPAYGMRIRKDGKEIDLLMSNETGMMLAVSGKIAETYHLASLPKEAIEKLISAASINPSPVIGPDSLADEIDTASVPTQFYSEFASKNALERFIREEKGLALVFTQTQITAQRLNGQCEAIGRQVQKALPKSIQSVRNTFLTLKSKKSEPFDSRDFAVNGKFQLNGKSICEFVLLPDENPTTQVKKIAGEILSSFEKQSVEKQYLSQWDQVKGEVRATAERVRKLLPASVDVREDPLGQVEDPSGNPFCLAVNVPAKAKIKEIESQCRLISNVKAQLPPTINLIVTVRGGIGGSWWTLQGKVKGSNMIGEHFLQQPYLPHVMNALKQLGATTKESAEAVTTLNIGESGQGSVSRSKLLLNDLAAWQPGDTVTLYSLRPDELKDPPGTTGFHGWKVLGSTKLDVDSAKQVTTSISSAVEKQNLLAGHCFIPRHGLRISHGGQTTDFIVCFQCREMVAISGDRIEFFQINKQPKTALNAILSKNKITLAPDKDGESQGTDGTPQLQGG